MKINKIKKASFVAVLVVLCAGFSAIVDYFSAIVDYFASNMKGAPSYIEAYNAAGSVLLIPFMLIVALVIYYFPTFIDKVFGGEE